MKSRFTRWLQKLISGSDSKETKPQPASRSAWPVPVPLQPKPSPSTTPPTPVPQSVQKDAAPVDGGEVELPLPPILDKLPADLRSRLTTPLTELGEASISIPASQILPQLATGAVRIEFGQLRGAAANLFNVGDEYDSISITLPLDVVLARLNRRWLARDSGQKKMESPKEIGSVFLRRSDVDKAAPAPVKPAPPATPSDTFIRVRAPQPPTMPAATVPPTTPTPAVPLIRPVTPLPASAPPKPATAPIPFPGAPISPFQEVPPASPVSQTTPPPSTSVEVPPGTFAAPLLALSEKWPDALRNEITQLNLTSAQVFLPLDLVEEGLKRGIVTFFWRDLRPCIRPNPLTTVSIHDGAALELPLKVIAPLFIARKGSAIRSRLESKIDKSIPNVFVNASAVKTEPPVVSPITTPITPLATSPAAAPPLEPAPMKLVEAKKPEHGTSTQNAPGSSQTEFKRPGAATETIRRRLSPNEVVSKAMAIKGVEGAMIVLHDGLMVTCELPPYLNSDTAAAFLPQIYERLSQCIDELHMGPLSHLRFNVGNVSWFVFRQKSVFFAVFSREGELPPEAQLAPLAAELDRSRQ